MSVFRRPDGMLYEYEEPRVRPHRRRARLDRSEAYYVPRSMEPVYYRSSRHRYLPHGCAIQLLLVVTVLAFIVLALLTIHPQGFQLIHF